MDWAALGISIALCLGAGAVEGAMGGSELPRWLASLKRPRHYAPLGIWIAAAAATYLLQGCIAYRLIAAGPKTAGAIGLALLVTVMAANVAYNVVLDRSRSPRFAYVGIVLFLLPLLALEAALVVADPLAAALNLIYLVWVAGYDLPIMRAIWKLNSPPT